MTRSPALQRMRESSKVVRDFVEEKIIEPKRRNRIDSFSTDSKDFLDNLMNYIDSQKIQKKKKVEDEFDEMDNVKMDRQTALYALVPPFKYFFHIFEAHVILPIPMSFNNEK